MLERAARRAGPLSDTILPEVIAWRTERQQHFHLVRQERWDYWMACVDSERLQPRRLWQSFDQLLGCGQAPATTDIDTSTLHRFSTTKSLAFVTLPLVHLPHSSQLRLSVASFDFSASHAD